MTYSEFIKWALKQPANVLDYDKTYGLQCVDLIKWYIKKVRGIEPHAIGNAIDYYYARNSKYIKSIAADGGAIFADFNYKIFKYQPGDIIVFGGGKYGHIAILKDYDTKGVHVYDTNYKGKHTTTAVHYYKYSREIKCVIRMSTKYTQPEKKYFTPTHKVKLMQIIYADNDLTLETGFVSAGELVKVHFQGKVLSIIQYATAKGYKVGLIKNSYLEKL